MQPWTNYIVRHFTVQLDWVWQYHWTAGKILPHYSDAKKCDLSEADKDVEMAKILEARKTALGSNYMDFSPWK